MKILAIMGSPRGKGDSYALTRTVEEKMRSLGDVEFEYVFLKDLDLKPCRGCYVCLGKGEDKCPLKDDRPLLEEKMRSADAVIFTSPTYVMNVTGLMKNFIDRFAYVCHRHRFFKRALVISTSGGIGHSIAALILSVTVSTWGYNTAYRLGVVVTPLAEEMLCPEERKGQKKKNDAMAEKAAVRFFRAINSGMPAPGIAGIFQFEFQKAVFSRFNDGNVDHEYWKSMGWLDRDCHYYYGGRVGILKLAIATIAVRLFRMGR